MNQYIRLITDTVTTAELKEIAKEIFGDMVKAVVDIEKCMMAIGPEMHVDAEAYLLERGSKQADLWGINVYPDMIFPDMVEFDSMINIRPRQGNRSRDVQDHEIRKKILAVVQKLIT
jgi:hypothetical protein